MPIAIADVPVFSEADAAWDNLTGVQYHDIHGTLLWSQALGTWPKAGQEFVHDGVTLRVRAVAVLDNVQHVVVEPAP